MSISLPYPVIDSHVHVYPDALAIRAVPSLAARYGNSPSFDGTAAACSRHATESGIAISLNLPVATKPSQNETVLAFANKLNQFPGMRSIASIHPDIPDLAGAVAAIVDAGLPGIKFHAEYQAFDPLDARYDALWSMMAQANLVAYFHAGGERVFKAPYRTSPAMFVEMKRRFPSLKLVLAHLGGFQMWDEAERTLMGQDVFLDLSHTFFWMDHQQILRMIRAHGAERILFGSDAPWQDVGKVLEAFLELPLSDDERRAICYTNSATLFKINL